MSFLIKKVHALSVNGNPFDGVANIFGQVPVSGGPSNMREVIVAFTNIISYVGIALSLTAIAYGFIQYIISGGNPDNLKSAWNTVLWGFISFLVIVLAIAIKTAVFNALGVRADARNLQIVL